MLSGITDGGTFLLNTTYPAAEMDNILPNAVKRTLHDRHINFYIINAYQIAKDLGLGVRINTIMQTAFFKLVNLIDYDKIKATTYMVREDGGEFLFGHPKSRDLMQDKKFIKSLKE